MNLKTPVTVFAFFAFSVFTAFKAINNGKVEYDLQLQELRGKVKWCKLNTREISDNRTNITYMERFYNNEGNVVKEFFSYVPIGKHKKHTDSVIVSYDTEGRKVLEDEPTQHTKVTRSYHYNEEHMLVEALAMGNDSPSFITYNAKGYPDNFVDYTIYGKFNFKVIYKYDDADNNIDETRYMPDHIFDLKTVRLFDDKHHVMSEITYNAKMEVREKKNFSYDNEGRKIMEIDSAVRMLRRADNTLQKEDKPIDIDTYIYQYLNIDNAGNWLQKITTLNGKKTEEIKREITYYE